MDIKKESAFKVLDSYYKKINDGLTANAAAYATVCREISQSDLIGAYRGNPPEFLTDDRILQVTEPVYKATLKAFSSKKELKTWIAGISVWKFNASVLSKASIDQRETVSKELAEMYSTLDGLTFSKVMDARSSIKTSKVDAIHEILQAAYAKTSNSPKMQEP